MTIVALTCMSNRRELGRLMKPMLFHILLILMEGESHGYGIVKALEERLPDEHIEPGNLYRTLRTLMADGLIEESDRRPDPTMDDQRRRYFGITESGVQAGRDEAARMEGMLALAKTHKLLSS